MEVEDQGVPGLHLVAGAPGRGPRIWAITCCSVAEKRRRADGENRRSSRMVTKRSIAAVYLDGGIDQATAFIARQFTPLIPLIPLINDARTPAAAVFRDFKSALQERVQSAGDPPPEYAVIGETGPDHHKTVPGRSACGRQSSGRGVGPKQEGSGAGSGAPCAREAGFADEHEGRRRI